MPLFGHSAKSLKLPRGTTVGGCFAECQEFSTRQSSFSGDPVKATLPSVLAYALGKVAKFFFVSLFSVFRYKYNRNISKYMDITDSYYNKYIIDKYDNNTDTNNTSPSHISQVQYITQVHHIERVRYV